jgi:hypothetical protein
MYIGSRWRDQIGHLEAEGYDNYCYNYLPDLVCEAWGYIGRANLDRFENDVPVLPALSGL